VAELHINGSLHKVDVPADTPPLRVLRDELGLPGLTAISRASDKQLGLVEAPLETK
jgi:aerobic-type carbon monoxide dehydrogenase small subunit (CoxS/CutS family)